jgi:hypothetical protein
MSKKKGTKKKGGKRYGKPRVWKGEDARKAKPATARKRGPRSRPLPGLEQVRDQKLDNICEELAEVRERMNEDKKEDTSLMAAALKRMQDRGVQAYRHNGIELARVPGVAEKVRVRLVADEGDAEIPSPGGTAGDDMLPESHDEIGEAGETVN